MRIERYYALYMYVLYYIEYYVHLVYSFVRRQHRTAPAALHVVSTEPEVALFEHDGVRCGVRLDMAGVSTDAPRHSWRVEATEVAVSIDETGPPSVAQRMTCDVLDCGTGTVGHGTTVCIIPPSDAAVLRIIRIICHPYNTSIKYFLTLILTPSAKERQAYDNNAGRD